MKYLMIAIFTVCFAAPKYTITDLNRISQADAHELIIRIPARTESTIAQSINRSKVRQIKAKLENLQRFFIPTFQFAQHILSKDQEALLSALANRTSHAYTTGAAAAASADDSIVYTQHNVERPSTPTRTKKIPLGEQETVLTDPIQENKCATFEPLPDHSNIIDEFPNSDVRNSDIDASTTSSSDESIENRATDPVIADILSQLQTFTDEELDIYLRIISTYVVLR